MREVLSRLLRPEEPVRIFGRVALQLADGRYVVTDDQGRKLTVDGPAGYLPGTPVVIQSARIVDTGSRPAVRKTIKV